jgi:hypothetical protein
VNERQIEGIRSLSNESTDDESRLVIQVRHDANGHAVVDAVSTHMPSDEAEVIVDPQDWESDVVCPCCGTVIARRDGETGNPLTASSTLIRAIHAPPDSPETYRAAQIWANGGVTHECGDGLDLAEP